MKHRLFILLFLIALMIISLPATAGAIPKAPTSTAMASNSSATPETASPKAPSFGVYKGNEDALISQMPDGTLSYLYSNVSSDAYEAFGEMLETHYSVLEDTVRYEGYTVSFDMADAAGAVSFNLTYDGEKSRLIMLYPAGTVVEEMAVVDPFTDRLEVVLGQKLITSYGSVSIDEIHLMDGIGFDIYDQNRSDNTPNDGVSYAGYVYNGSSTYSSPYSNYGNGLYTTPKYQYNGGSYNGGTYQSPYTEMTFSSKSYSCWFEGSVENNQKEAMNYSDIFSSCALHYVNLKDDYAYEMANTFGGFDDLDNPSVHYYRSSIDYTLKLPEKNIILASFDSSLYACCLKDDIPEAVIRATDGILALTFTVDNADYVLYLRK